MRKKIVAGNWKMNTTVSEAVELAKGLVASLNEVPEDVKLVVAPPFTNLVPVSDVISGTSIALSSQNCADQEKGAYTGEVSAKMVKSVGCSYVILGHSERREYYGETSEKLVKKIKLALGEGLSPIFCIGEKLQERQDNIHFDVIAAQIKEVLFELSAEEMAQVVVAYEPVWAIGTGVTATSEQAQEIHAYVRGILAEKFGELAQEISILYGGSCKPSYAKVLFACPDIDGGLIGGAALKASDFIAIAQSY